jgi:hypothetical protein
MNGQVRISLFKNDFNRITELVKLESEKTDEKSKDYVKFFNKIMTYSFISDDKVTINLFPSEARLLIYLLNRNLNPVVITNDWMQELMAKKEKYKAEKESENNA